MNDVHSYMQGQSGLMDTTSTHDLDFLNFDDRGPFLSKYETNDSHGLFSNSISSFNVSQTNGTMQESSSPFIVNAKARFGPPDNQMDSLLQNPSQLFCSIGNSSSSKITEDSANIGLYSGDVNIQLTTSELLNESGSHQHEYTNSSEINSNDNSPVNIPDLALYNHNNEKMTSINPKIAHSDLQHFMPEDNGVGIGLNNFQTIFDEASTKESESTFGNLEMLKDARSFKSNNHYNTVDDEYMTDESEDEAIDDNKYKKGKKDIAWRWTWLNLQISELHKQIQMCDSLLHNIQVEKEIVPADLGQECARTAGLRINKRVKIVKLAPSVQSTNKQFHPMFVPSLANVSAFNSPVPARPRGKQDYPMSPPRSVPRRKDLTMSSPYGRANNRSLKSSSESAPRRKLTKSDSRNNLRRSTPTRPRDRDYDVDNIILPGRVSTLRRSVDTTPKEIFTPTFRILPELSPEEEWQKWEEDHRAKKARKLRREQVKDEAKQSEQQAVKRTAGQVVSGSPAVVLTDFMDSTSLEDDDDILLIKTSLESSPVADKSRANAVDTSLDADSLRIESMASIDRAEALKSFQATLEQQTQWKYESPDTDSQSVNSHSPVLISAPLPQLPVSCEDSSQCNRQSNAAATQLEEDSESSSYSSDEEDISNLTYSLRHFKSELKERIRWEKPDPTSPHYNTHMKEDEFLVSRLFQSYTPHLEEARRLPPELWQDNLPQEEEEPSFSYANDRSDEEWSTSHTPADGLRPRRKRPLSPSSESSHPPKRARIERRDDDFIRDYDRHIADLSM